MVFGCAFGHLLFDEFGDAVIEPAGAFRGRIIEISEEFVDHLVANPEWFAHERAGEQMRPASVKIEEAEADEVGGQRGIFFFALPRLEGFDQFAGDVDGDFDAFESHNRRNVNNFGDRTVRHCAGSHRPNFGSHASLRAS
jgi:hypothetical protein